MIWKRGCCVADLVISSLLALSYAYVHVGNNFVNCRNCRSLHSYLHSSAIFNTTLNSLHVILEAGFQWAWETVELQWKHPEGPASREEARPVVRGNICG